MKIGAIIILGNFWHCGLHYKNMIFLFFKIFQKKDSGQFLGNPLYRSHWHFRHTFVIAIFPPFTFHCVVAAAAAGGYSGMDISIYIHYYIGGSWAFPTFPLVRIKLVKQGPIIWRTPALVNKFTVIYANLEIELPFTKV